MQAFSKSIHLFGVWSQLPSFFFLPTACGRLALVALSLYSDPSHAHVQKPLLQVVFVTLNKYLKEILCHSSLSSFYQESTGTILLVLLPNVLSKTDAAGSFEQTTFRYKRRRNHYTNS